jgi:ferric-dicitrate binding protein FerR (iron transport regulator)
MMKPGELVEVNGKGHLIKTSVKPDLYTSWKNKELIFDQTKLSEIARILEDNFGYTISFEDSSIMNRKFTGSSKTDEIDMLLTKISKTNDLKITKHNQTITINNP